MIRLCLTAEGKTEQQFATQVLVPHLSGFSVYLSRPRLAATSRKKHHVQRGGLFAYKVVKNDLQDWLRQERGDDVRFTTMFDLYGLPRDFPGQGKAVSSQDKYARVQSLEAAIAEDLKDPRFIPYIQLHEFEAILFSDPEAFRCYYEGRERQIEALVRLRDEFGNPELIDDGEATAPSKRIGEHFRDYEARKPTAGPIIAERIGLEGIRKKCSHFNEWLTKLEQLGEKS